MAAAQVIPSWNIQVFSSFYYVYSRKSVHICANTYEMYIVSNEYCVSQHDGSLCSVPNCKYHFLLIAEKDILDLMQKLDTFCFRYQLVDCINTLFKYRFDGKIVIKNDQIFDNVERAVQFNQRHKTVERMPSITKKRLLRKKYKTFTEFVAKDKFNTDERISCRRQD